MSHDANSVLSWMKYSVTHIACNIFKLIFFRYGREMGSATENALSTVGNSYLTAYNAAALGPKSLAKRAAKTTGLYF